MSDEVKLRAVEGALKDDEFVFEEKGLCLVGRSSDCALNIPKEKDMRISRRHCLLILDPPKARIRDLGSRNGTFVNGNQLDPGCVGEVPEQMAPYDQVLNNGDMLSIGETEFEVIIPSQEKTSKGPIPLPPGTKVIKLAKPANTQPGSVIPRSTPVDTGFFIAPTKRPANTATAPLTEAIARPNITPKVASDESGSENKPAKVVAKKVFPASALKPANPAPDATLILRAKPTGPDPDQVPQSQTAEPAPPPAPQTESAEKEKPRKVLKGKIVKRKPKTPTPAAPPQNVVDAKKEYNPELTEVMDVSELSDDIKLSSEYIKKEKSKKRVTKFKVKRPK